MKAFFLLSCLLLFMASGVDQTKSQQTSSPTSSIMSSSTPAPSQSSSQSTPTMETSTAITQRTSQAMSASTRETPTTTTQGGSPLTKASTTEPPTTTTQGGNPPTKASTTEPPTTTTQGGSPPTNASTTQLPTTTTQGGNQTTAPPPSVPDEPCTRMRCYSTAQCINLKNESFCLCPEGYYYKDQECNPGKTFPGMLNVEWDISDLDDPKSQNYQNLHLKVQSFFQAAFSSDSTFGQTVILSLQTRSKMRSTERVEIMVTNLFNITSKVTEKTVNEAITRQAEEEKVFFYQGENICNSNGCSDTSEDCSNGFQCVCREGLARPFPVSSSCSVCDSECSEKNNKQCVKKAGSLIPECACLPDYFKKGSSCQACDFGYSGIGCKDNYMLIFTVVCVIGGVILLGTIIGLIVLARSKKKGKNGEEDSLINRDFSNVKLETTGFNNPAMSSGGLFPKVNVAQFSKNQSNVKSNPYEDPHEDPYFRRPMPTRDY